MASALNRWGRRSQIGALVALAACSPNGVQSTNAGARSGSDEIIAAGLFAWPGPEGEDLRSAVRMIRESELPMLHESLASIYSRFEPIDAVPRSPSRCAVWFVDDRGRRGLVSVWFDVSSPHLVLVGDFFADRIGGARAGRVDIDRGSVEGRYWGDFFMEAAPASILSWAVDVAHYGDEVCSRVVAFQTANGSLPPDLETVEEWDRGRLLTDQHQPVPWLYKRTSASDYELRAEILIWEEEYALLVYKSDGQYPIEWIGAPTLVECIGKWLFIGDAELVEAWQPEER